MFFVIVFFIVMVIISQDNNEETDITMIEEDVGMFVPSSCSLNTRLSDAVGVNRCAYTGSMYA
jgi:hypothetical protein